MYDYDRSCRVLELGKILTMLSNETGMQDAAEAALAIKPVFDKYRVELLLRETEAAHTFMARFGAPSFGGAENVNSALARAKAGGILSAGGHFGSDETFRVIRAAQE